MRGQRKRLAILGATGSIGTQALAVIRAFPEAFEVVSLTAGENVKLLAAQAVEFRPRVVAVATAAGAAALREVLRHHGGPQPEEILSGEEGLCRAASLPELDLVLVAVVGLAGLAPTLAAIHAGKDVALANKETLVAGGELVREALQARGRRLLPVDSEHSAIFQCLAGEERRNLARIWLTASGGPFRGKGREELVGVTPAQALAHPNWRMGRKISVDSATMMNKGLEAIEAHWLFQVDYQNIKILIHPQSIVHSLVELVDGTILAQLGAADMRLPIQYALTYPERWPGSAPTLDWGQVAQGGGLTFAEAEGERYPALRLAFAAGEAGGTAPAVLNAANEAAVKAFLEERLPFLGITPVVEAVLTRHSPHPVTDLEGLMAVDAWARAAAEEEIRRIKAC